MEKLCEKVHVKALITGMHKISAYIYFLNVFAISITQNRIVSLFLQYRSLRATLSSQNAYFHFVPDITNNRSES